MQRMGIDVFTPFCLIIFRTVQTHRKYALGILHVFICLLLFETLFAPISIQWIMPEAHAETYNGLHLKFCYCHLILTKTEAGEQILLKITEMNID